MSKLSLIYDRINKPSLTINELEECVENVSLAYNAEKSDVIDILLSLITFNESKVQESPSKETESTSFIYRDYNVNEDDQASNKVEFSDQEYMNRDFTKTLNNRFPRFVKDSFIPNTLSRNYGFNVGYINRKIFDALYDSSAKDKNWTNQTLSYSRINVIGRHIIDCIVQPLYKSGLFGKKVHFVDATANVGADSILFAMESMVSKVTCYEILTPVYNMLKSNIQLYGMGEKIAAKNRRFDYDSSILRDTLVMIDPPYESPNNATNFNLSIDITPIYNVAQKCLDNGAKCVILSLPKNFKYNSKFALDNEQFVTVYQMGKKNNKMYVVMSIADARNFKLMKNEGDNFSYYTIVPAEPHIKNSYKCKIV